MHSTKRRRPEKKAPRDAPPGRIRIIGGEYRGRRIALSAHAGVRPTPDRVRETLFNWLGQRLEGLACLDLFAGSGALGFEAASRGASRVVMVEKDREGFKALESFRNAVHARQVELVLADAFDFLGRTQESFDVVFLDPPFGQNAPAAVLERLPPRLAPGGRVYVEAERPLTHAGWREIRRARAGQVSYQLLERQ